MSDKSETVSVRMSQEMRQALKQWTEEEGYSSEADAIRGLIRGACIEEAPYQYFEEKDEIIEKLEDLEKAVEEANRPFWSKYVDIHEEK